MREILFRGKRIDTGEWIYGDLRHWRNGRVGIHNNVLSQTLFVDPETIGQYTGLNDKNERRIFEGDIVKCRHIYDDWDETFESCKIRRAYGKAIDDNTGECIYWRNYVVRMCDGRWVLRNGSDGHNVKQNYVQHHLVEIIGNIHDNPELLTPKEE